MLNIQAAFGRKLRPAALCACLAAAPVLAWSQVTLVDVTPCGPQTFPTATCTIPATGSGHLIVIGFQIGGGAVTTTTVTSVTDNAGNVYAEAGAARAIDTSTGSVLDIWYAKNSAAGATTVTITPSATVTNGGALIWEFSGASTTAPLDQTAVLNTQASSSTPPGAAVTTTGTSDAIVSMVAVSGNVTAIAPGNAFTNDSTLKGNGWAHYITGAAGTYAAQWSTVPAGVFASSTASFKAAGGGSGSGPSPCDLNGDGVVNVVDVQLVTDMYLGTMTCTANIAGPGICNSAVVNSVTNAALTGTCVVGNPHSVTLTWTASTSSGVTGYNVYRGNSPGGPYSTKLNTALVTSTTYTDSTVYAGQNYYYVTTAVSSGGESGNSNQATAVVPFP